VLLVTEIFEGFPKIKGLLPSLARSNEFGFRSRHKEEERKADAQRDMSAISNDVRARPSQIGAGHSDEVARDFLQ